MKGYKRFFSPSGSAREVQSVLVIDVSGSMAEEDYKPSRLGAAVAAACELIKIKANQRPQDKVGIVAFSSYAEIICGLTKVTATDFLTSKLRSLVPKDSTDFVAGLKKASQLFSDFPSEETLPRSLGKLLQWLFEEEPKRREEQPSSVKHIIFLTDGHHNCGGSPIRIAEELKNRWGIQLDCIGIAGKPEDVDEKLLKKMASLGPDGKPRYRFIDSTEELIKEFRSMAIQIE